MSLYAHPLPGRCQGCGSEVFWNGKYWRPAGKGASRHVCPITWTERRFHVDYVDLTSLSDPDNGGVQSPITEVHP